MIVYHSSNPIQHSFNYMFVVILGLEDHLAPHLARLPHDVPLWDLESRYYQSKFSSTSMILHAWWELRKKVSFGIFSPLMQWVIECFCVLLQMDVCSPTGAKIYIKLKEILLLGFNSKGWPFFNISTSECFCTKMPTNIWSAMKPNAKSLRSHMQCQCMSL